MNRKVLCQWFVSPKMQIYPCYKLVQESCGRVKERFVSSYKDIIVEYSRAPVAVVLFRTLLSKQLLPLCGEELKNLEAKKLKNIL